MERVVLLRVFDVVVMDESATVNFLCSDSSKSSRFSGSEGHVIGCET